MMVAEEFSGYSLWSVYNGGGINASMVWYNLYGAFAKHGCAYPVGYKST